jgi:HlyD family secretion protein
VHQAQQQLAETVLTATCDGTVLEVLKREGDGPRLIDPEPVALFADLSHLRVRGEIEEHYVHALKTGQQVVVSGRGLGKQTFTGRVAFIKQIMGKKTVFARTATERKDLDVLQVLIDIDEPFVAPVGLQVDIRLEVGE